jgi:threonylcarbamoyladenosine tRNA methylthiotransferase MtaB
MHKYRESKVLDFYRAVTIVVVILSFLFIILGAIRFFQIDFFLNFLPETTRGVLDESPKWIYYVYLLTILTNLIAAVLLYRRHMFSVTISQYSALGMIILIGYHFFITDDILLYEAEEMLFTLVFYPFLAWFAVYARRNGHLSKISKERTTVPLKIQEGCNHECAYCPAPLRKGHSRSDSLKNILANAEDMAEEGIKDIVLIGDNVGDFGTGENGNLKHSHNFFDLLNELDKIGDVHRFSFLSISTPMFSDRTLNFIKNSKRLSPYFSIKMDSASDTMLKKMNRPFPLNPYKNLFINIKRLIPEAYITVEIIVGFPGETDDLFDETVQFLSEADISHISTTIYTDKIGTEAYKSIKESVPRTIRKKRKKSLVELSKKKLHTFYESQLGSEKIVLFEGRNRGGYLYGYTDNHVKVKCAWNPELCNTLQEVKLIGIKGSTMLFDFIEDEENAKNNYIQI